MSIHRSLSAGRRGGKHRNVLTREERLVKLEAAGRWDDDKSVFGVPKVRSIKPIAGGKKKKKKTEDEDATADAKA